MDFSEAKLKKTITNDRTKPILQSSNKKKNYKIFKKKDEKINAEDWFATNFDQWYEDLKDYTVKSEFITMTKTQIKDFLNLMEKPTSKFPDSIKGFIKIHLKKKTKKKKFFSRFGSGN